MASFFLSGALSRFVCEKENYDVCIRKNDKFKLLLYPHYAINRLLYVKGNSRNSGFSYPLMKDASDKQTDAILAETIVKVKYAPLLLHLIFLKSVV